MYWESTSFVSRGHLPHICTRCTNIPNGPSPYRVVISSYRLDRVDESKQGSLFFKLTNAPAGCSYAFSFLAFPVPENQTDGEEH